MKHLDLFSGIGGFALAARNVGWETIAFSEVDKWCQRLLKKHWPKVPQLGDITQLGIMPTSSRQGFHARTYPTQAMAPDLPESVQDFGGTLAVPFAWYDQSTRCWRTWQRCLVEGWTRYRETWPRAGMTRSGIAYQRQPLAPLTRGIESGLWPTPTVCGNYNRKGASKTSGDGLATAVKLWPTPTARDYRSGMSREALERRKRESSRGVNLSEFVQRQDGGNGKLNPQFTEWLMGYPIGWTELVGVEMPSSQKSQRKYSKQSNNKD